MNNRKISLINDCVFKTMFKESSEFRKLLNKIFKFYFDFDLSRYNLTSEELEIVDLNDIKNKVDLLLTDNENNYFLNIEVNRINNKYYYNRNLSYEAKIILHVFRNTKDYEKKFKVMQININNFPCPDDKEIISTTMTMYDIKNNIKDERVVTHNLYLGKFKKIDYNTLSDIEKDLALLNCDNLEEMKVLAKSNSTREKIMSEFKRKITNEEFLEALFDPEIEEEMILNSEKHVARDEGHAEGLAEGLKEASIEIAKSLLSSGMDIKEISKHTKLSIDEIEKLENQK